MFLDDHMSSSGWNIKHLKVTFAKCAAAAVAAAATAGAKELGKKRQKQVTLADTQTLGLQRRTSQTTTSLDHFALQRGLERGGINTGEKTTDFHSGRLLGNQPKAVVHSHPSAVLAQQL